MTTACATRPCVVSGIRSSRWSPQSPSSPPPLQLAAWRLRSCVAASPQCHCRSFPRSGFRAPSRRALRFLLVEGFMTQVSLEILLIFVLILANGVFSASEIALVSARKARLRNRADQGDRRALAALKLAEDPDKFLSTVQVGITSIGILTGVFGGATIAEQLSQRLEAVPVIGPHGETIALTVVVVVIAYFSVVLGELVPKRIALANAERLAGLMAPLMSTVANVSKPAVRFLSWSSDLIVRMLRIPKSTEPVVTEEELRAMLRLGTTSGTFHP